MLTPKMKSLINQLWDNFWSGGIANPLTAIEQISYLLFMRRLDELDLKLKKDANGLVRNTLLSLRANFSLFSQRKRLINRHFAGAILNNLKAVRCLRMYKPMSSHLSNR